MYKVRIEKEVKKKLHQISEPYFSKIQNAILKLADNPRPKGYKKLLDRKAYRVRVGVYRIIYEIHDDILLVDIIRIGHRKEIYN